MHILRSLLGWGLSGRGAEGAEVGRRAAVARARTLAPRAQAASTWRQWLRRAGFIFESQGPLNGGTLSSSAAHWNTSMWCTSASLPSVTMGSYCGAEGR